MEPWGTPHFTIFSLEVEPFISHFWVRLDKYDFSS